MLFLTLKLNNINKCTNIESNIFVHKVNKELGIV